MTIILIKKAILNPNGWRSYVKEELYNVAVLHNVFLTLAAKQTLFLDLVSVSFTDKIVKCDDLCTNEAALKVRMYLSRGSGSLGASLDRPGANLLRSRRKEADQAKKMKLLIMRIS